MSNSFPPESPFAALTADQQTFSPPPRRSGGGRWILGLALIFLGCITLGGIVCIAGLYYVVNNMDRWLVGLGREAIVAMINESEISATEKTEVITEVDRVVTAYKARKINQADLEKALNDLNDAPALKVLSLYGLDEAFLTSSGLTEEEITAGRRSFERALRGVYEGKFSEEDLYAVLPIDAADDEMIDNKVGQADRGDNITLVANQAKSSASDDDIRESLAKLKVMVDNARIPDEPFQLDISDEVKKIVDRLLAGKD